MYILYAPPRLFMPDAFSLRMKELVNASVIKMHPAKNKTHERFKILIKVPGDEIAIFTSSKAHGRNAAVALENLSQN